MGWLIGGGAAVGLVFLWMTGHWLGRVVAFVAFFLIGAVISQMWAVAHRADPTYGQIVSAIVAWLLSGLPVYRDRWSGRFANNRF